MAKPTQVAFVSLGCAKNLVDSEKMLGQLAEAGCAVTADESRADVIVINTCGFLEASRTEALAEIADAVEKKRSGRVKRVVVAGCLVQRDGESIRERVQGVDALVGVNNRDDIVLAVLGNEKPRVRRSQPDLFLSSYHQITQLDIGRLRLTPKHYAYLRISEGCDQKCTFCTIPSIRGPMHSKPVEAILAEARELAADGAVEISLIGQDTTSYGQDLGDAGGLAGLLRRLDEVDGVRWFRLMYVYPSVFTDEMIDAVAECEKVVKYIDIPLQHINDRVLKSMHRRITRGQTEQLLGRLRERISGVTIRTTMIVGFPGETEAEFEELTGFVRDFGFDALGVFAYSREAETPAGRMKEQIPQEVKEARVDRLMRVQQEGAFARAASRAGSRFTVLVDGRSGDGRTMARHAGQAPSVDGVTWVSGCDAGAGEFVEVRCDGSEGYDLTAVPTRVALTVL
ncbi:MAG: ribosomal protein S12 methylthiotransferase RimO [Planctomycetota bacterium]|nr:MAG: ribosomal protein S12 methylthiotransferase RimO [Planctomycetota bacterium]